MNSNGLGLTECLVGVALSAVLCLAGAKLSDRVLRSANELSTLERLDSSLGEIGHFIKLIGRTASECFKSETALVCVLNPMTVHKQTNQLVFVQFILTAQGLEFQRMVGSNWSAERGAREITAFTLCDINDMPSCPILPNNLSLAAVMQVPAPSNFFRFQMIAEGKFVDGRRVRKQYQSSFAVRNGGALVYE